jgi:CRP-like cAMP-binding protein
MADTDPDLTDSVLNLKLRAFGELSRDSAAAIADLERLRPSSADRRQDLIREGDDPKEIFLILEGWACRYEMLEDGRRQITSFFLPGDLCDLHVYVLKEMDHSIAALTPLRFARITSSDLETLGDQHPRVMRALWWDTLVSSAIQREWMVTAGQRDASEALAHLCCELFMRLRLVGHVDKNQCDFPLTQADIADALGLTPTHVGRTIQKLERAGLLTIERRSMTVHDLATLQHIAAFNPNYLHWQNDR